MQDMSNEAVRKYGDDTPSILFAYNVGFKEFNLRKLKVEKVVQAWRRIDRGGGSRKPDERVYLERNREMDNKLERKLEKLSLFE
jgi:hypothetical protein